MHRFINVDARLRPEHGVHCAPQELGGAGAAASRAGSGGVHQRAAARRSQRRHECEALSILHLAEGSAV